MFQTSIQNDSKPLPARFSAGIAESAYLRQGLRPDACGHIGITPLLKFLSALRQLSYGLPADMADDLFDVSKTTAALCLQHFCESVKNCIAAVYLQKPKPLDIVKIEKTFSIAGF